MAELNGNIIKAELINAIGRNATGSSEFIGGTVSQSPSGQRSFVQQQKPFSGQLRSTFSGWNPFLWNPTIVDLSVDGGGYTKTVLSVDNCAVMLGRTPYDFGNLSAPNSQVLSGYVFAIIQHPVWGNNYYDVSAILSCGETFAHMENLDNNFSVMPLYYVDSTGMTKDFRGIPTITMYS